MAVLILAAGDGALRQAVFKGTVADEDVGKLGRLGQVLFACQRHLGVIGGAKNGDTALLALDGCGRDRGSLVVIGDVVATRAGGVIDKEFFVSHWGRPCDQQRIVWSQVYPPTADGSIADEVAGVAAGIFA